MPSPLYRKGCCDFTTCFFVLSLKEPFSCLTWRKCRKSEQSDSTAGAILHYNALWTSECQKGKYLNHPERCASRCIIISIWIIWITKRSQVRYRELQPWRETWMAAGKEQWREGASHWVRRWTSSFWESYRQRLPKRSLPRAASLPSWSAS